MNTEKLLNYINHPNTLNAYSLDEIQRLVQLFPYSQNVQLLYLFNLSNNQDIRFSEQLQKTATYASDRGLLKKQLEALKEPVFEAVENVELPKESKQEKPIVAKPEQTSFEPEQETQRAESIEDNKPKEKEVELPLIPSSSEHEKLVYNKVSEAEPLEDLVSERNRIRSKAELLQRVKDRLNEIEEAQGGSKEKDLSEKDRAEREKEAPIQNKLDLINRFIQVEPSISRPEKSAFFDPDVAAQESVFEDGAFVTETLAKIYCDQGNYKKAIEIYQILSLNNPEKSSYFAAQIQELEKKLH